MTVGPSPLDVQMNPFVMVRMYDPKDGIVKVNIRKSEVDKLGLVY
jgi:hypothetical protein